MATIAETIRTQTNCKTVMCILIEDSGRVRTSVVVDNTTPGEIFEGIDFLLESLQSEGIYRPHNDDAQRN